MAEALDAAADVVKAREGDPQAAARLFELMYTQLRAIAGELLRGRPPGQTLQPTALVHEAFVRIAKSPGLEWADHAHFLAIAAKAMRHILVDYARRRGADKRGGAGEDAWGKVTLDGLLDAAAERQVDVVAVDELLAQLARLHERQAQVVELRFFGGLSIPETARVLEVSHTTVENDWAMARAWLLARLAGRRG